MRVLILANGEPPSRSLLHSLRAEAGLFIATDGAAATARELGSTPDIALGDFDSLNADARSALAGTEFVNAQDQNASDLEKAISYALCRGAESIRIAGALGRRMDHALTAISLLVAYGKRADIRIVDSDTEIRAVSGTVALEGAEGDTVSLIALSTVEGVTTQGLLWPLSNQTLAPGSLGVSNVMVARTAQVTAASGTLIVCHLRLPGRG